MPTGISWTEETVNPVPFCSKVSEGCRFCYAERISLANGWTKLPWTAPHAAQNLLYYPERMKKLLEWKSRKMVFLNSMGDLFHEMVKDEWLTEIFQTVDACSWHIIQILTKRIGRAAQREYADHVWIGTSVEDARVKHRIDTLRHIKAGVRFISFEPLIGSVGKVDLTNIDWVIVGGESGPNYRKLDHEWAREIRNQAVAAGVPFFFKQDSDYRSGQRPYLREVDGQLTEWKQHPEVVMNQPIAAPTKAEADGKQMELF